jgi:hypothetical protein
MLRIHGQGSHRPNLVNHLRYDKSLAIDAHVQATSVRKEWSCSTSSWPWVDIQGEMARMRSLICGVLATLTSYEGGRPITAHCGCSLRLRSFEFGGTFSHPSRFTALVVVYGSSSSALVGTTISNNGLSTGKLFQHI